MASNEVWVNAWWIGSHHLLIQYEKNWSLIDIVEYYREMGIECQNLNPEA